MALFQLTDGPDTLYRIGQGAADMVVALAGADLIFTGDQADAVYGNQANDTLIDVGGNNSIVAGQGNDLVRMFGGGGQLFGNEGADTIDAENGVAVTIVGGVDSADLGDFLLGSAFADVIFGNGGADTIDAGSGANTVVGGHGADLISGSGLLIGNEDNDTIFGATVSTMTGGTGADVFNIELAGAAASTKITDLDWSTDKLDVFAGLPIQAAGSVSAVNGVNLQAAAANALNMVSGDATLRTAAQFTFDGRTFVAVDQFNADFQAELIVDITGATGSISIGAFVA